MDKIKEVFVVLENEPGTVGKICRIMKKKRISIFAIGVFQDQARLYLSHPEKAVEILKEHGYEVDTVDVLRVILPNKQGAMMELTMKLGNAGININYLYGALQAKQRRGTVVLEVDNPKLAIDIFKNHHF